MSGQPFALDKARVRSAFERAASGYDRAAALQRAVREELLLRLGPIRLRPRRIVDLGSGTGHGALALARRYRPAEVIAVDFAQAMLGQLRAQRRWFSRTRALCADIEHLPLADACADMVFSNLTLQWCVDLQGTFAEIRRVLRPGGLLMFTTFGPDTLGELRAAWAAADGHSHVNLFLDMHDVGDAMLRAGLAQPVLDVERTTVTYPRVRDLMAELKAIGAHNATAGRPHGLTGRARLRAVEQAYEAFRRDGRLPASYEVIFGHAWGPEPAAAGDGARGEVAIPVDRIGRPPR